MSGIANAPPLAPGADSYHSLDFSTAGTLADKIGEWRPEWKSAIIQPDGADLEFRADGTNPTAGNGILLADGTIQIFENQSALLKAALFIGGTARVQLFG